MGESHVRTFIKEGAKVAFTSIHPTESQGEKFLLN